MTAQSTTTTTGLAPEIREACDRAAGRAPVPPDEPTVRVQAAHRDISSRGRVNVQWYRLALRPGSDTPAYFSAEREPRGMRSADRHWTGYGHVPAGTLLMEHDRGAPIGAIWLVHRDVGGQHLQPCAFEIRADGQLSVTLPDGTRLAVPNPRR